MKKSPLAVQIAANAAALVLSSVMLGLFIWKNFDYIVNPELSPHYNEGTPFGDGPADWGWMMGVSLVISRCLIVFNIIFFASSFLKTDFFLRKKKFDRNLLISILLVLVLAVVLSELVGLIFVIVFVLGFPLALAAAVVFLVIFIRRRQKTRAFSLLILLAQWGELFALEMFAVYLYLD